MKKQGRECEKRAEELRQKGKDRERVREDK